MPTVAPYDIEGHVVTTAFIGDTPYFATASGEIHKLGTAPKVVKAHEGLLTCVLDPSDKSLVTGGEDGRVLRISSEGDITELANVPRKWISVVAPGPLTCAHCTVSVLPCG